MRKKFQRIRKVHPPRSNEDISFKYALSISAIYQVILFALIFIFVWKHTAGFERISFRDAFAAWDGRLYLHLAEFGYSTEGDPANFIAFFPLYPWCIRAMTWLGLSTPAAGVFVSHVTSIFGHTAFILLMDHFLKDRARVLRIALLLFVSPIAVYFGAVYTESLFLFLTMGSLYFLYVRSSRIIAGLFGGLATGTRLMSVTLVIPYAFTFFEEKLWRSDRKTLLKFLLGGLLIPVGYAVYLLINYKLWNDAFYYTRILAEHWYKYPVNPFVKLMQEFPNLFRFAHINQKVRYVDVFLSFAFIPLCAFAFISLRRRIPLGFWMYNLAQWGIIISQSFWLSSARYLLLLPAFYIGLEVCTGFSRILFVATLLGSLALSIWIGSLYLGGGWAF